MNKKYKFTGETKQFQGVTLHQIQALRSFGEVSEGDIGGWIEKEENLSHEGDCWVGGDARVFGSVQFFGSAQLFGRARVYRHVDVMEDAEPSSDILPEELKTLPESIEEVTIKGVKYKKVTKWERA